MPASSTGKKFADGELFSIAYKLLSRITADDIRGVYATQLKRSERQAAYAMQVLRAVLRWHGVVLPGNPLGRETAGRDLFPIVNARKTPAWINARAGTIVRTLTLPQT